MSIIGIYKDKRPNHKTETFINLLAASLPTEGLYLTNVSLANSSVIWFLLSIFSNLTKPSITLLIFSISSFVTFMTLYIPSHTFSTKILVVGKFLLSASPNSVQKPLYVEISA